MIMTLKSFCLHNPRLCRSFLFLACITLVSARAYSFAAGTGPFAPKQEFYNIKVYQLKTKEQQERVEKFLKTAFLPALHRVGIPQVGVFTAVDNDTAAIRRVYVLIPFHSLEDFVKLPGSLEKDKQYLEDGKDYLDATYNEPAYVRIESILLQAFPGMPVHQAPDAIRSLPASERIYELRSYEGPSEKYFSNKVQMFNQGDEIGLFKKLGFNAVFYASVISGAHMPNLMYMTSFENKAARDEHWKSFGSDPFWKKLSAQPEYQHNVSHIDDTFLHPTDFSDL
jgi:hypothetical protein